MGEGPACADTRGVIESDNMYLAPADRLSV